MIKTEVQVVIKTITEHKYLGVRVEVSESKHVSGNVVVTPKGTRLFTEKEAVTLDYLAYTLKKQGRFGMLSEQGEYFRLF